MYSLHDLKDKIKKYFTFNAQEIKAIVITTFIIAFIFSFKDWGPGKNFEPTMGLNNLINAFIIVLLALLVKISVQKIYALHIGYSIEYKMWIYGILASLILCFASNGSIYFLAVGGFMLYMMPGHRLGYFRYDINYFSMGVVALIGPLANILLALFFKIFSFLPSPLIQKAMLFNALIAIFSMLPIPPLDGSKLLYASRPFYVFALAGIVATGILILTMKSIPMIILLALVFAVLAFSVYFFNYELK